VNGPDVLPALLKKGDQEVDRDGQVNPDIFLGHLSVTDADSERESLFQLELHHRSNFVHLVLDAVRLEDGSGEFTSSVHERSDNTGNLLDQRFGRQEDVEFLAHLLHELLVLVQLLQVIHVLVRNAGLDSLILVELISDDANGESGAGDFGKSHGPAETLVLLGVVVLQGDLQVNALLEVSFAVFGLLQHRLDGAGHNACIDLGHFYWLVEGVVISKLWGL
jgi:hypothetical protein